MVQRFLRRRVPGHDPHAGLALRARFGQQPGAAVGEAPPQQATPGLARLLRVWLQPAGLHQVHHVGGGAEVEQQVLAARADAEQFRSHGRVDRGGVGLQGGEADHLDAVEDVALQGGGHPFGVRAHLGQLWHAPILPGSGRAHRLIRGSAVTSGASGRRRVRHQHLDSAPP